MRKIPNQASHDTKDCRVAPTGEKCKFKGHVAADCRMKMHKVRKMEATTELKTEKQLKPPTRPCRMCDKIGHYDSACPDLLAFKNFRANSKKTSIGSDDDDAEFTNIRTVKAKEVILCSSQTKSKNEDVYVKLESLSRKSNFLIQLDGGA